MPPWRAGPTLDSMRLLLVLWAVLNPGESHRAETRGRAVFIDGQAAWKGRAVTSPLVWSPHGDAVGFTARDGAGRAALIVVVVAHDAEPAALSWPIPPSAEPARAVTWLGPNRLGAGPSELAPKVIASFSYARALGQEAK